MSANVVRVMASQVWADQIAQLLHDGGVNVPVVAPVTSHRAARCQTFGRALIERRRSAA